MAEEIKQNEAAKEQPADDTGKGNQPEAGSIIDRADIIAKRLEEGNKKAEELAQRIEGAAARVMLGGRAEAGVVTKTPEQVEKEKAEADIAATMKKYGYK